MKKILFGEKDPGEIGVWISNPGADVYSGSIYDFLLSSDAEIGQVVMAGYITKAMYADTGRKYGSTSIYGVTIPHGLGYVPLIVSFMYLGSQTQTAGLSYAASVDSSNIYANFLGNPASVTTTMLVYYALYGIPIR